MACCRSTSSPSGSRRACWPQFRILSRGDSDVSERLARDLLFFCAQAAPGSAGLRLPRLDAARAAYSLPVQTPIDYSLSVLGRFDPAIIVHAKKRVAAAKEAWSATAGGEMHRISGLAEQFALVGDSLRRLFPLRRIVRRRAAERRRPDPAVERAAAGSPGDGGRHQPALHRGRARGRRLRRSRTCRPRAPPRRAPRRRAPGRRRRSRSRAGWRSSTGASPTGRPWAASSRSCAPRSAWPRRPSTSSSATRPTAACWSTCRCSSSSMRGVLSVLGMDQASQALLRMRDEVDGLVSTEVDPAKIARGRRVRPHRRQPERARLPDRHAQRAAAAGQVAVRVRCREAARSLR